MKKFVPLIAAVALISSTLACSIGLNRTFGNTPIPQSPAVQVTALPAPTILPLSQPTPNQSAPASALPEGNTDLIALYKRVNPGVVSITVETPQGEALGSGFVYDTQGRIITNFHVIDQATAIEVDFPNGFKSIGKVIGTDTDSDIAVIQLQNAPASEMHPLTMGDSAKVEVGQSVVAIGNPFGYSGTMTTGIISGVGRTLESIRQAPSGNLYSAGDIIQTDAAINPGNSGGPLLTTNGEVIGINRAIESNNTLPNGQASNSGVGFAVSINIVKRVAPFLIKDGKYDYPYLGISAREQLSLSDQQTLGLSQSTGGYVEQVVPGGPADQAGVHAANKPTDVQGLNSGGDLITAVDGHAVIVFGDLLSYLMNNKSPGDKVTLTILRDNQTKEVVLTLGKRP
ncbi:MAG TPA: trypsin-like peptidase domain-containing protein [Anaerolineaceae bacterium]|jgi:2-alkenal reductase